MKKEFSIALILAVAVPAFSPAVHSQSDPRDSDSPYGVLAFVAWDHEWNHHYDAADKLEHDATLAEEAGIRWVRMDFLWSDIEPAPGRFDFGKYDHILEVLSAHHLHILGLLEYNPSWHAGKWNDAPNVDAYLRYARQTVRHFKDRVKYWEIWNEPDQDTYWMPQDDLAAYANLLKQSTPVIKEEDPTARVLMGGLAKDYPFHLRSIYKKAGAAAFDVVNIHPFVSPLRPNAIDQLHGITVAVQKVMAEFGDGDKPIWFTEIGCPGVVVPVRANGWWEGTSPTEEQQAQWLRAVYSNALKWPGVDKIFWAFLRDTDHHFGNGVDQFGVLTGDFRKKPAYDAYRALTSSATAAHP